MTQDYHPTTDERLNALVDEILAEPLKPVFCGGGAAIYRTPEMSDSEVSALQRICDERGRPPSLDEQQRIQAILQN